MSQQISFTMSLSMIVVLTLAATQAMAEPQPQPQPQAMVSQIPDGQIQAPVYTAPTLTYETPYDTPYITPYVTPVVGTSTFVTPIITTTSTPTVLVSPLPVTTTTPVVVAPTVVPTTSVYVEPSTLSTATFVSGYTTGVCGTYGVDGTCAPTATLPTVVPSIAPITNAGSTLASGNNMGAGFFAKAAALAMAVLALC